MLEMGTLFCLPEGVREINKPRPVPTRLGFLFKNQQIRK